MKHIPQIKSVMTPFPYSVDATRPLREAETLLEQHDIHHLPVVNGRQVCGVVTTHLIELAGEAISRLQVGDVCKAPPYVVDLKEPLDNVVLHMAQHHLELALVMRNGALVGVFTATDACRYLGELLREQFHPPNGGEAA